MREGSWAVVVAQLAERLRSGVRIPTLAMKYKEPIYMSIAITKIKKKRPGMAQ